MQDGQLQVDCGRLQLMESFDEGCDQLWLSLGRPAAAWMATKKCSRVTARASRLSCTALMSASIVVLASSSSCGQAWRMSCSVLALCSNNAVPSWSSVARSFVSSLDSCCRAAALVVMVSCKGWMACSLCAEVHSVQSKLVALLAKGVDRLCGMHRALDDVVCVAAIILSLSAVVLSVITSASVKGTPHDWSLTSSPVAEEERRAHLACCLQSGIQRPAGYPQDTAHTHDGSREGASRVRGQHRTGSVAETGQTCPLPCWFWGKHQEK